MRQRLITFLFAFFAINAMMNAETVQLSFSGVTTEGRYCLLDSVKIENLTQNWSQTLDCCIDTTYELPVAQVPTGIDNIAASDNEDELLSISQNFAIGNTLVTINPLNNGVVRMRVMDMIGRVIIEHAEYLSAGYHQYLLQLGTPQTYMLSVVTDTEHASAKILNITFSGRYDLSRVTSLPTAYQSPRKARAAGADLMQYTGYTNQKGVAVASEPITQYQSSPEQIVFHFAPVAKGQEGMYVGILGFNSNLYPYSFDILTSSNLYAHQNFVSNLTMANGTILYHAVYTSLDNIVNAPVPEKLENVSIVTFTDGLDIGSWHMNSNYPSEALYLAAVNKQIHRTYIDGIKLDAYSIGVKGSDVTDEVRFESDLHQLASDSANVFRVSNMDEVNTRFRDIAAKIYNTKVNYSMTIKLPAPDPGSIIRFTFDNVTDANNSIYYIEGTYDYDFGANMGILKDVIYNGVQCSDGTTWTSVPDGIFDIFTIHNIATNLGERVSTSYMRQWSYIPSTKNWQINSEFDLSTNSSSSEERTSALVMLVLDCSSSLGGDFSQMQSAANNFLSILAGKGNINKPTVSSVSVNLGDLQATLSATIVNTGNLSITGKGFCVSEHPNMDNAVFYYLNAEDEFEYLLTDLVEGKTYYVCSFAENQLGRRYGYKISFDAIAYSVPTLTTSSVSDITISSATCGGTITSIGHTSIIERGICWSKEPTPTIEDTLKIIYTSDNAFSGTIDGLEDGTIYYVRAYAKNSKGVGYGNIETFTTIAIIPPTLTSLNVSNITTHSAQCGGTITDKGNSSIIERGLCWSTNPNPTIEDTTLILGSGMGNFNGTIDGLEDGTTYYVRAYAKNTKEVGYGDEISFTTIAIVPPTVTTSAVSNITASSAQCGGSITNNGNSDVLERGLCWSKNPNPTIEDTTLILGSGTGNFNSTITDLEDGATYYVRAYAKNSKNVGYGEEKTFTTLAIAIPVVTLSSVNIISASSANCSAEIIFDGNTPIIEQGFCWSTTPNPTIEDNKTIINSTDFSGNISGLDLNTYYYVRAYVKNSKYIGYSEETIYSSIYISAITYTATSKLIEATSRTSNGLHTSAFGVPFVTHEYDNGQGSIVFSGKLLTYGDSAFYGCTSLTSVDIPNSVMSIGNSVFRNCSNLISVNISSCVTSIGNNAFYGCSSLTSVTIPNSVTSIGNYAFYNCESLTSVTIPNSVTSIGVFAFSYCSGLTSITIPNSVTSIAWSAFSYCSGLTSVTIPYSVTSIGDDAFYNCTGLTSVTIPNSVTSIRSGAFEDCRSLTSIELPNSITSIGSNVFRSCSSLTSIEIPNSVTSIGVFAFSGCTSLTSIEIPNSITRIEGCAFSLCTGLTSVTIPNSVTYLGSSAFSSCTGLTSVNIPNSIISIEYGVFSSCTGLTSIELPNSITSIGERAFQDCACLTSITIPSGVTSIGVFAFSGCTKLTSITSKATTPPTITDLAFYKISTSIPVYVPAASVSAYKNATGWKKFTKIQAIP